jgi:integrase
MLKIRTRRGTLMSPGRVHQVHRTIRTALNEAVRRGHLERNPAELAKTPPIIEHEVEPYSVLEVQRLIEAAKRERNGVRWVVALALGLRQGEALRKRIVPLPGAIIDLLLAHRESQSVERQRAAQLWSEEGWIFADETGRAINPRTDWDGWKRLLAIAGVRDGRLHDARHTAATDLLLLGVHERTIMSVLGWSTTAMASRYTQ